MKKVLLIGDSIRYGATGSPGYGGFVKELLSDVAEVYSPDDNCRFAQYTLREIHSWADEVDREAIDLIHWNNGLWDVLRLHGDEPLTPCDIYVYMLGRVHRVMKKLFPNAKIVFATSTAVVEEMASPDFFRYNTDIEAYNAAATELMNSLGVPVNDLYAVSAAFPNEWHSDFVHFGEDGSRVLADRVAAFIRKEL